MTPSDRRLFRLVNKDWTNPTLDLSMPFLSWLANDGMLWLALLGTLAALGGEAGRWSAPAGLIALGLGAVTSDMLKDLTAQARPSLVLPEVRLVIDPPNSYSG